jgi:hypothetical protein
MAKTMQRHAKLVVKHLTALHALKLDRDAGSLSFSSGGLPADSLQDGQAQALGFSDASQAVQRLNDTLTSADALFGTGEYDQVSGVAVSA